MATVLYTSSEVRRAIIALFKQGKARRAAVVAYVGDGARTLLPRLPGIEIFCCPQPGSTNPYVLRDLRDNGAIISFVDRLHMKAYWAEGVGAVITSANLSSNSLGSGNLDEAGVFLHHNEFDIERLFSAITSVPMSDAALDALEVQHTEIERSGQAGTPTTFADWLVSPRKLQWKLFWWNEFGAHVAARAKQMAKDDYGTKEPEDFMYAERKNDYEEEEWVLSYKAGRDTVMTLSWRTVDFVVKVPRTDRRAFEKNYPYQAIQIWPLRRYRRPPFQLDHRFRRAFKFAAATIGVENLKEHLRPTKKCLRLLDQYYAGQ